MKNTSGGKTPENIVLRLKEAVDKKGQSAVARESGIALYSVQRYLKGIGYPTKETLAKLSAYFGVSTLKLVGDSIYDQMTAHDYYGKLTSTIDVILEMALKSKMAEKNRLFLLAAVSTAKLITEMPVELREMYDQDYLDSINKQAELVIAKYSDLDLFERYTPPKRKPIMSKS